MHDIVRIARGAGLVFTLVLVARVASAGSNLPIASAQPRVPQAVVQGTSLQDYLTGVGEPVAVLRDQIDVGLLTRGFLGDLPYSIEIELSGNANSRTFGIYNGHDALPALWQVFPGAATSSWFAEDGAVANGADADYADLVCLVSQPAVCVMCTPGAHDYLTPVQRSTWGELKSRFR